MSSEYLVLGIKGYDFENKENGQHIAGVNVFYLDLLMEDYEPNVRGYTPLKTACTPKVLDKLSVIPGFYKLDFRQKPGAGGKPTLVLADAEFVGKMNFTPVKDLTQVKVS